MRAKRNAASEAMPSRRAVCPTRSGEKEALSSTTARVSPRISVRSPPMTPAMAMGSLPLVISMSLSVRTRSLPSSVVMRSPSPAALTVISRAGRVLRSNACRGCPSTSMT